MFWNKGLVQRGCLVSLMVLSERIWKGYVVWIRSAMVVSDIRGCLVVWDECRMLLSERLVQRGCLVVWDECRMLLSERLVQRGCLVVWMRSLMVLSERVWKGYVVWIRSAMVVSDMCRCLVVCGCC